MKPVRLLGWFCAIVCGIALTWSCAAVGYARVWLTGCRYPSKVNAAKRGVRAVEQAISQYRIDENRCPTTADLVEGKYLHARDLVDPWGTVIVYRCSGDDPTVMSAGRDREFGSFDDIKNTD
jgi:hypothetical protein